MPNKNVVWHKGGVSREEKESANSHRGLILWFTGLSGSGKSTLAGGVEKVLHDMGAKTVILDGDNIRHGLCADLGFSGDDRKENIRRIGEVAKLFVESGNIVLTAFISPFRSEREKVRRLVSPEDFVEIFVKCPISICEQRDVKGLYKKARAGEITDFTGISSPYEEPERPEMIIETDKKSMDESVMDVVTWLKNRGSIRCAS